MSGSFHVSVANLPPTVKINTPGPGSNLAAKTVYSFKATFADAGKADTHTCTINWGDGTSSTGTVTESGGAGTCASSHAWASTGNYTITVTVKDSSGATATATSAITVTKTGGTVYTVLSVKKAGTLRRRRRSPQRRRRTSRRRRSKTQACKGKR